jgi:hypothetical protein
MLSDYLFYLAMFSWDTERCSTKLIIDDDDQLTVKVKDGSGFKTSLGNKVPKYSIANSHITALQSRRSILLLAPTQPRTPGEDRSQQKGGPS